jgi:lipoprotein-anchoring transpeptidase ErfK/SrfK
MENKRFISVILAGLAGGLLGGCVTKPPPPPPPPPPAKSGPPPYTWNDNGAKGPSRIVVDVSQQRAYFYRGATCVGETRCSTGKTGFETVCGTYQVTQKNKDHVSNLYGNFVNGSGEIVKRDVDMSKMKVPDGCTFQGAKMPFFLRFTSGYGLHAGRVPDYPASHGCVRLPRTMAQRFFENSTVGTPVVVRE